MTDASPWCCAFCGAREGEPCKSSACMKASHLRTERDALKVMAQQDAAVISSLGDQRDRYKLALEQVLKILGPKAPKCDGCEAEFHESLIIIGEALEPRPAPAVSDIVDRYRAHLQDVLAEHYQGHDPCSCPEIKKVLAGEEIT